MDRQTTAARAYARPRLALDPDSLDVLDARRPGEARPRKPDGFGNLSVATMAQEAYWQTEALLGIWHQLERIANALETPTTPLRNGDPE